MIRGLDLILVLCLCIGTQINEIITLVCAL